MKECIFTKKELLDAGHNVMAVMVHKLDEAGFSFKNSHGLITFDEPHSRHADHEQQELVFRSVA